MRERKKAKQPNPAHILFEKHLLELGLEFRREWRFHPLRKWRFDYVIGRFVDSQHWEHDFLAIEICGQIWHKGGHSSGKGIQRDYDKANAGTMLGWRVLHFSTTDVLRGRAKAFLAEHLGAK